MRPEEGEVLIASSYAHGGQDDMGRFRTLLSHILNRTYSRVLSFPLRDLSSGFRMYHRDVLMGLALVARDFDMLEEVLIRHPSACTRIRISSNMSKSRATSVSPISTSRWYMRNPLERSRSGNDRTRL